MLTENSTTPKTTDGERMKSTAPKIELAAVRLLPVALLRPDASV